MYLIALTCIRITLECIKITSLLFACITQCCVEMEEEEKEETIRAYYGGITLIIFRCRLKEP